MSQYSSTLAGGSGRVDAAAVDLPSVDRLARISGVTGSRHMLADIRAYGLAMPAELRKSPFKGY